MAQGFHFFSVSQFPVLFTMPQPSLLKMLKLPLKSWIEQFEKNQFGLSSYAGKFGRKSGIVDNIIQLKKFLLKYVSFAIMF